MIMKIHSVPVKRYVYKYMQPFLNSDGIMEVPQRVAKVQRSVKVVHYFQKYQNSPHKIKIQIPVSSQWVVYSLAMEWARQFRDKMYTHVALSVKNGIPALRAMRNFLDHYQITDDDYDVMSSYRTWQRQANLYLNPHEAIPQKMNEKKLKKQNPASGIQLRLFE